MPTELEEQLRRENQLLRDQIARLLSRMADLQRQLEDVTRERAQTDAGALVAALAQSIRDADAALAAEAETGPRFTMSEVDATFRGAVVGTPSGVALRLPVPEYGVLPGHLGSIRVSMAVIPPPVAAPSTPAVAPASADGRLRASLERVQARFSDVRGAGEAAAGEIVSRTTRLLSAADARNDAATLAAELDGIASALTRTARAHATRRPATAAVSYREAARALKEVSRGLRESRSVTDASRNRVSDILETLGPQKD